MQLNSTRHDVCVDSHASRNTHSVHRHTDGKRSSLYLLMGNISKRNLALHRTFVTSRTATVGSSLCLKREGYSVNFATRGHTNFTHWTFKFASDIFAFVTWILEIFSERSSVSDLVTSSWILQLSTN